MFSIFTANSQIMSIQKRLAAILFIVILTQSCKNNTSKEPVNDSTATVKIDDHPDWSLQGNIYEVNVRQYTAEGTFAAFEKHLQRLKDMGVQTLWFMPITPISKTDRKGALGSYYAVADYKAINPEFGNLDNWKHLVNTAHDMGFKVIIDWVPNHTGGDHPWLTSHPDFYAKDSTGKVISPFDWTDVRKLNYKNPELVDTMIASMEYWLKETNIDGFRCDVAGEVPKEFWTKCISTLKKNRHVFMLAETNDAWVHEAGFDATYPWDAFNMMKLIAKGERPAFGLDSILHFTDSAFTKGAMRLYFTSNHDENSWNKADYGTMPGASHAPFAVFTQTAPRSIPLIYSGQEEPFLDSISFFYKDTISFGKFQRANFYKALLNLRKNNAALAADASFKKIRTTADNAIYAFEREKNGQKVFVILNLSSKPQRFNWTDKPSEKEWDNLFLMNHEPAGDNYLLEQWGYVVYYKK
jgi:alpha-amylase